MSKMLKLEELENKQYIQISKGKQLPKEYRDKGKIKVIGAGRKSPYSSSHTNYTESTITISSSGAYAGYVWIHDYPIWASDCTVIRVNEKIDIQYLYLFLKSKQSLIYSFQSGAGQPHVYWKNVKNIEINLPTLTKQKEIASVLDKVQELISLRKESIKKLDELSKSIFIDMFGDPVSNPKKWNVVTLNHYGSLSRGKSSHRPRNAPELYDGKYPFIQTGSLSNGTNIYLKDYKQTYSELGIKQSKLFPINTIGIAIAANIGNTKILKREFYFPDSVVGFITECPEFCTYLLSFYKVKLEERATKTAQKNINLKILNELEVIEIDKKLQNKFANIIEKIEEQKSLYEEELEKLEENFKALLQKSFK